MKTKSIRKSLEPIVVRNEHIAVAASKLPTTSFVLITAATGAPLGGFEYFSNMNTYDALRVLKIAADSIKPTVFEKDR